MREVTPPRCGRVPACAHTHGERETRVMAPEPILEARELVKSSGACRRCAARTSPCTRRRSSRSIGDNGAGKSTLVKTLVGVHPPDSGEILFEGKPVTINTPHDARELGIETVYPGPRAGRRDRPGGEHVPGPRAAAAGAPRQARLPRQGRDAPPQRRGLQGPRREDPGHRRAGRQHVRRPAPGHRDLPRGHLGRRSCSWTSRPPRSASCRPATCSSRSSACASTGLSVVLISHNMPEVFEVADRIEVLRLGTRVARLKPSEVSMEDVVAAMTGALTFHEEETS